MASKTIKDDKLLLVDLGGSRIKSAVSIAGDLSAVKQDISPSSLDQLIDYLVKEINQYEVDAVLLAIPGRITVSGSAWMRAITPFIIGNYRSAGLIEKIKNKTNVPILLIQNDMTCQAAGILKDKSGTLLQLSTGVGFRDWRNGKPYIKYTGMPPTHLMDLYKTEITVENKTRTISEWLSIREIRKWVPPEMSDLNWRELVWHDVLIAKQIATATEIAMVELTKRTGHDVVYLCGGGSLALAPFLNKPDGIGVILPPNANTISLEGLEYIYRRLPRNKNL